MDVPECDGNALSARSPSRPEQPIRLRRRNQIIRDIKFIRVVRGVFIHDRPRTRQPMNGHRVWYRLRDV